MRLEIELFAVVDLDDAVEHSEHLHSLNNYTRGMIACDFTPGQRSLGRLADALLTALGKRADMRGSGCASRESWGQVISWMVGERISHLVISRAHLLTRELWEHLIELAALSGASLWLVLQQAPTRGQREGLRDWPFQEVSFPELQQRLRPQRRHSRAPGGLRGFPPVPDDEFPTFRASCQELLEAPSYAIVERVFNDAQDKAHVWLADRLGRAVPSDEEVVTWLQGLIRSSATHDERLVRLRAAQVVFFSNEYLINVNRDGLAGGYAASPLAALDEATCEELRVLSPSRYAAAAVLSLASRQPPRVLACLNIGDIDCDARHARIAGDEVAIPACAQGIVRAHIAARIADGVFTEEAPLFVSEQRKPGDEMDRRLGRTTTQGIQQQLRRISLETSVSVVNRDDGTGSTQSRFLRRRGVTVRRLDEAGPRA